MNLTALSRVLHEEAGGLSSDVNSLAIKALIFVVENYFLALAPSFVLTLSCRNSESCKFYNDLLQKLFRSWEAPPIQIVNIPRNEQLHVPGSRYCNMILVDSYDSFRAINVVSYTAEYNNNEYYYIYLQMRDRYLPVEMLKIFDYCWQNHLINCNIQIQTAKGEILIYTYYPFTTESCGSINSIRINQFNGTALVNEVLFPKKLTNFHGCKLRVATWNVPPFIYLDYYKNSSGRILGGIESHLLFYLSERLNFTIEIRVPPNDEQRGVVKGNNVTGALLMLRESTVDFSLGSFRYAADRASAATTTVSYYQTTQIICVPLAAYKFSSMEILLFPFSSSTWLLLMAIFVCGLLIISLLYTHRLRYGSSLFNHVPTPIQTYLNLLLLTVGMPTAMPGRMFARLLCTNWMLFTLILRTVYQALLFHMIRTRLTKHVPQTFEELVDHNYTVRMNRATYLSLIDVDFLRHLDSQMIPDVDDTVQFIDIERNSRKHLAAAGPLDFLLYYASVNRKAGVFRILPQRIVSFPVTMYLRKHSYLIDQFNEQLMWLGVTGFIDVWSRLELDEQYLRMKHPLKDHVFGLTELHMLFAIVLVGHGLAVGIFILEIVSKRVTFLKKIFLKIK